jgi:hypothetical protein
MIASYFLAVALKLIPGVHFGALFGYLLPPLAADAVAAGAVFLLTFAIMIGLATRLCAIILGLMTVYASSLGLAAGGDIAALGALWADLALVAGLMFLYGDCTSERKLRRSLMVRPSVAPRRVDISMAATLNAGPQRPALPSDAELRNIFQSADRPKSVPLLEAPKAEEPKIERLADYREEDVETTADATFLRSASRAKPILLTNRIDNIFITDPESADPDDATLPAALTMPRRVVSQRA